MPASVVSYELEDQTKVYFEIEPPDGWTEVSPEQVLGQIKAAAEPAVEGAKAVLDKVKEAKPQEIEVKFGIKVSGEAKWFIAKAATEANFEVTLTWKPVGD